MVPAELLLPEDLAGGGFIAERHARVVDAEQEIVRDDEGGNVRRPLVVAPGDVGLGDIAAAVGPDGQQMASGQLLLTKTSPRFSL